MVFGKVALLSGAGGTLLRTIGSIVRPTEMLLRASHLRDSRRSYVRGDMVGKALLSGAGGALPRAVDGTVRSTEAPAWASHLLDMGRGWVQGDVVYGGCVLTSHRGCGGSG